MKRETQYFLITTEKGCFLKIHSFQVTARDTTLIAEQEATWLIQRNQEILNKWLVSSKFNYIEGAQNKYQIQIHSPLRFFLKIIFRQARLLRGACLLCLLKDLDKKNRELSRQISID